MTDQGAYNRQLIEDFRANRRNPDGPFASRQLLLLTTTGARSGHPRTTPLMYLPEGTHLLVIASNAGAPSHPDWYHNLVAHPAVTVEVQDQIYQATAIVAEGEERQRLWEQVVAAAPFFAEHQAKISRSIPVILLKRQAEEAMA